MTFTSSLLSNWNRLKLELSKKKKSPSSKCKLKAQYLVLIRHFFLVVPNYSALKRLLTNGRSVELVTFVSFNTGKPRRFDWSCDAIKLSKFAPII